MIEFLEAERGSAPESDTPGIERLIARVERERDAARDSMVAFLGSIEERGAPEESVRRFGPAAAPLAGKVENS